MPSKAKRTPKRYLSASERVARELRSKVNTYLLLQIFEPWQKNEFGRVDRWLEDYKQWENNQREDQCHAQDQ